MKRTLKKLLLALGLLAACASPFAVFDPVNDDTDLFRNNPNIPAERPNVLIILDNTANWNNAFTNEKTALMSVVNNLDSNFNVGWMMYPETGGGNDSIDGAYVRFGMRQMTATNKAALSSMINAFHQTNDKGNNSTLGLAMHEAYLYFGGRVNRASYGKVKTDFAGNTANNPIAAALAGNALPAGPTATSAYTSAITDACQKNYIIYISNGPANENASARAIAEGLLTTAKGSAPSVISITPNGQQDNWADEYAQFMAGTDISPLTGVQNVITYTVEVDPGNQNADQAMTGLMKSMATHGKGKYFAVTSANSGVAIVEALNSIFSEIQAVNSVFAASTLPVSVNVRGTNLNQLYIGVFRPDASDRPRWLGNLKAYQLRRDSVTNTVFTVDANLNPAINSSTGFITSTAKSFWTDPNVPNSTYWGFRSASVNGVGGSSDSPDGDLVEKGGAAQQLRARYFLGGINGVSPDPARPLYTCTQGAYAVCNTNYSASSSLLSATPFAVANTDIDAGSLAIDSRIVTPLTAVVSKTVSAVADRRVAVLSNTGTNSEDVAFDIIRTNTDFACYFTLSNTRSVTITAISNGAVTKNFTAIAVANGNNKVATATATAHGFGTVQVLISGTGNASFDGLRTITSAATNAFSFGSYNGPLSAGAGTASTSNTTVNVTAAGHGLGATGAVVPNVTIAGVTPAAFNGVKTVTVINANEFSFPHTVSTAPSQAVVGTPMTASSASTVVTATKPAGTNCTDVTMTAGEIVNVRRFFATTADAGDGFQGDFTVLASPAPTSTSFSYQTSTVITTAPIDSFYSAGRSGTSAAAVIFDDSLVAGVPFAFTNGGTFTLNVTGATPAAFNGGFTGTAYNLATDPNACAVPPVEPYFCSCGNCGQYWRFNYTVPAGTGFTATRADAGIPIKLSGNTSSTVTVTLANHGFVVGDTITLSDVTGASAASWNLNWVVASVIDSSTFTFSTGSSLPSPGGSPAVRLATNPWAYATMIGHGYGVAGTTLDPFTVSGANVAGYNGTFTGASAGQVVDANVVRYRMGSAPGANTGGSMIAATNGLVATGTSAAHGFAVGSTVTISGASPGQFSGAKTILSVPSADTFTYAITPAAGVATGTAMSAVSAGGAGASERTNVINWVRGEDNYEDENANSSFTDTRASMHGDVLHSRPAVVNYNRRTSDTANIDNDVYIYYGGNDGVFRAVKGGFGSSTTTTYPSLAADDPLPGQEIWGFVARDHFSSLKRLRLNSPAISSNYKKPYFFDGPMGTYTLDANGDGMLDPENARAANGTISSATTGDKVWLYLTMRRGGRAIYALDVSKPLEPKMLWRKGCPSYSTNAADIDAVTGCDLGFSELGQTWSEPKVVSVTCSTAPCGATDPVLIFGAGYDAVVEDADPATISSSTSTGIVSSGVTLTRSMGRGLFVINARTGAIIWHASPKAAAAVTMPVGATYKQISGMDYSISADIAVVVGDPTPKPFRAYVGDTGGNMWRFDFGSSDPANWSVVKLAAIGDHTTTAVVGGNTVIPGLRKFQFAPDVIGSTGFDMVISGSGDREHPFDSIVVNRVYAFKDKRQTSSPVDGGGVQIQPTITHATNVTFNGSSIKSLLDVSTQCIEVPAACNGTAPQLAVGGTSASVNTSNALVDSTNTGWFITLAAGEKQVGSTLASGSGVVQFGTNQPSASAGGGACSPNLGVARQYTVNFLDGTAYNGTSLSTLYVGGGFLPSPVLVFVGLGGATGTGSTTTGGVGVGGTISGDQLKIGAGASTGGSDNVASAVVCYGASCSLAPGSVLFSRLRKFWYKEID